MKLSVQFMLLYSPVMWKIELCLDYPFTTRKINGNTKNRHVITIQLLSEHVKAIEEEEEGYGI